MRKDFNRDPGEHIVTWLLQCWDNGASSLELEGKEAKQLGSLARDGGIDKAIGKKEQVLSLWRRLLSGVRAAHLDMGHHRAASCNQRGARHLPGGGSRDSSGGTLPLMT